jgi:nitroimidazol reductase NimA-like FMN-containing flavoprotein (pyridoxamine 5'-phosphate oxidase superfamily)
MTALAVLDSIEHASLATVSAENQPWNTPVYFARDGRRLYWISRHDAQHSMNVRDNGRAFLVIYDSTREDFTGAGVFIEARVIEVSDESDIAQAVLLIYQRRNKPAPPTSAFRDPSPQRLYRATARRIWTNVLHADAEIPWDERMEVAVGNISAGQEPLAHPSQRSINSDC